MTMTPLQRGASAHAQLVRAAHIAKNDPLAMASFLAGNPRTRQLSEIVHRAAVTPGGFSGFTGMHTVASELAMLIAQQTVLGRIGSLSVPFATRMLRQNTSGSASWVGENKPVPASALAFEQTQTLEPMALATLAFATDELLRNSSPAAAGVIEVDQVRSLALAEDAALLDWTNAGTAATKPAALTYDAPQYAATGWTVATIATDCAKLIGVQAATGTDFRSSYWVMRPETAASLATMLAADGTLAFPTMGPAGGSLFGIKAITSLGMPVAGSPGSSALVLIDAQSIAVAEDRERLDVSVSTQGAVQMSDAPSEGAASLVSLWQAGIVGIRTTRWISWGRRRAGAVVTLTGVPA